MKSSVLIVDDEAGVRSALSGVLRDEGYTVDAVESGEACLDRVSRAPYDVIVLDIWLPGMDGLTTLTRLNERRVDAPVVMISGHGNIESAVRAIKLGAFDFVEKPLSLEKTVLVVGNAVRQRRLEAENRALRAHVDRRLTMVGESYVMAQLREQVAMAAPTNGRVLIYGENGTGKELVARSIHSLSRRRSGPFIEVNCAAIPEELIESELFGHVKGAFTDAKTDRVGRFELADTGTLFLDEIANVPFNLQSKLLRVLETGEMERVGSSKTKRVNARILSATNANLQEEVASGRFREDLLFRLNTIEIHLPALRERKEDIPLLASHFLSIYAQRYRKRLSGFDTAAMQALLDNPWQGNVRELNHVVERAVLLAQDSLVRLSDLALRTAREGPQRLEDMSLEDVEAFLIKKALARYDGNVSHAASALGLSRSALYRRLQRYNL